MKSKHDYYTTLGVDPGADAATIKKAYRKRAAESHPDRGGRHEDMAEVNEAFKCLSDPIRRLLYDQTGSDAGGQTLAQEVQTALMNEFAAALNADVTDVLYVVRQSFNKRKTDLQGKRAQTLTAQKKFETRRAKVKTKEGVTNLFHLVIDKQLQTIKAGLSLLDLQERVIEAALKELDAYESDEVIPRYTLSQYVIINSFGDSEEGYKKW